MKLRSRNMMNRRAVLTLIAGAGTWPVLAQGNRRVPRIGILWHAGNAHEEAPFFDALLEGFEALGYSKDSIVLEHRFPNETPDLFKSMAAEFVALSPDVIVGVGGAAPYVKRATSTIPIVFMYVSDPIGINLVTSIRRPGGNATGLTNFGVGLAAKRVEYLKRVIPSLSEVAILVNPANRISTSYIEESNAAAARLGMRATAYQVKNIDGIDSAFSQMSDQGMQAVVINGESLFYLGKDKIAKLALARGLPICSWVRELSVAGALLSYGTDQRGIARRVPYFVDRILKGEQPADMPVEQPMRFELCINLATARALNITPPPTVLAQADEIIE